MDKHPSKDMMSIQKSMRAILIYLVDLGISTNLIALHTGISEAIIKNILAEKPFCSMDVKILNQLMKYYSHLIRGKENKEYFHAI